MGRILCLIISTLITVPSRGADLTCDERLNPQAAVDDAVKAATEDQAQLTRLLNGRLLSRYESADDPAFEELAEAIATCPRSCHLLITGKTFRFDGWVNYSRWTKTIHLQVALFGLIQPGAGELPIGVKARGLAGTFANLLGSLFAGVKGLTVNVPEVKKVKILGLKLQNPGLADMLLGFGFKEAGPGFGKLIANLVLIPAVWTIPGIILAAGGTVDFSRPGSIPFVLLPVALHAAMAWRITAAPNPRNLVLEIPLEELEPN